MPLMLRWLDRPRMAGPVTIFERKFTRLLHRPGGRAKAEAWFLSGDLNFTSHTAERFAMDFLASTVPAVEDLLPGPGPDGVLHDSHGDVGIEVTTLNCSVGHWIFTERLPIALDEAGYATGLEIQYSLDRLTRETSGDLPGYIDRAASAIIANDVVAARQLDLQFRTHTRGPTIVWDDGAPGRPGDPNYPRIPWLRMLTEDVLQKLTAPRKRRQFSYYRRNIAIIGVNQLPMLYPFPGVLECLAGVEVDHDGRVPQIVSFWDNAFASFAELSAVGYYTYSIDQEHPFYPLRLIIRDDVLPITALTPPSP